MTEITLRLPDEDARRLEEEANRRHVRPEDMARHLIAAALAFDRAMGSAAPTEAEHATMSEEQFQEALERTMRENLELLKRLA